MLGAPSRRGRTPGAAGGSWLRAFAFRAGREDGMAMAAVVTLLGVGLAISSAAVVATNNVIQGSTRDERSKDALAAADAAAALALFRQNQVDTNVSNPCVVEGAGGELFAGSAASDGWCSEVSGEAGEATWTYRASPATVSGTTKSVSFVTTGNADGVTRRIKVDAETPIADALFGSNTVIGRDEITLDSNADVNGNAATNGSIYLSSNARLCGGAQYGEGGDVVLSGTAEHGGSQCSQSTYPETIGTVNLPPVDPALVAAATSTDRFFAPAQNPGDTISGNQGDVTWNSTTRTLTIDSNSALTIGGTDYRLCKLELKSNSSLIIAAGANVRLFFDAPENCPSLPSDGKQVVMSSNTQLTVTSGNPADLAILVVGSDTISTTVEFHSNSHTTFPVILYAPRSYVDLDSNVTFVGGIAGVNVHLDSNTTVNSDISTNGFQFPVLLHYRQSRYVECSATPISSPSDYC